MSLSQIIFYPVRLFHLQQTSYNSYQLQKDIDKQLEYTNSEDYNREAYLIMQREGGDLN